MVIGWCPILSSFPNGPQNDALVSNFQAPCRVGLPGPRCPTSELLQLRLKDLKVTHRGHLAGALPARPPRRARRARASDPAACLDLERVVQPRRHARHRHPVLSRASAPDAARAQDDHRRRGRHACRSACASCATRPGTWCSTPISCTAAAAGSELFGRSSTRYPSYYRPNPASRHYVQHLRLWYAQSHPDEDFAETFAVWLTPRSNWRKRYAGWPALKKLEYVDELMAEIAGKKPLLTRRLQRRPAEPAHPDAGRALREEAGALRGRPSDDLRPRSAAASSPTIRGIGARRRRPRSCAATAPRSGRWSRSGPASTS